MDELQKLYGDAQALWRSRDGFRPIPYSFFRSLSLPVTVLLCNVST